MSPPRRWLETEEASSEALELLRAGRPPRRMDDDVRRRSRRRVAGLSLLPAAAGAFASWPQLAFGALVGTAGTVAIMSVLSSFVSTSVVPASSPSPVPAGPSAAASERAPLLEAAPHDTQTPSSMAAAPATPSARPAIMGPTPVASQPPAKPEAAGLQQEIELLEEARRRLASEPVQAHRVLLEHERRFPGGQLRIEREFLLIDALARLGRRGDAEERARVLEGQAPASLYSERLDQILGRTAKKTPE
jgi:hypothetical protein